MINLLPPDLKESYRYAHANFRLLRWSIAFFGAIMGVVAITTAGLFVMNRSINSYNSHISAIQEQLVRDHSSTIEQQVADISSNLKLMVTVLSHEILFSKLLAQLGALTPSNVILTNLSIAQNQSTVDVTAQSTNYNAATQLQVNLADPHNQLFTNADIVSITCATGTNVVNPNYPCTIIIRAKFTANNPFLFINATPKKVGT